MKKIVAGNWKMNHDVSQAVDLMRAINDFKINHTQVYIFPPNLYIQAAQETLKHPAVSFGVQNVFHENSGAFTGEISCMMLKSLSASASIVGHSERRALFGETNESCNKKIKKLAETGLKAFLCCGESEKIRDEGTHLKFVLEQLKTCLYGFDATDNLVIAYEPVWAIGTGKTANKMQIEEMHTEIRNFLVRTYGDSGKTIPVLYGGSCNAENAAEIFNIPHVDGGLIGGASLKATDFQKIIQAADGSH